MRHGDSPPLHDTALFSAMFSLLATGGGGVVLKQTALRVVSRYHPAIKYRLTFVTVTVVEDFHTAAQRTRQLLGSRALVLPPVAVRPGAVPGCCSCHTPPPSPDPVGLRRSVAARQLGATRCR